MITDSTIQTAVQRLRKAASPEKIILFGSYARGEANEDSDLDFLMLKKSNLMGYYEIALNCAKKYDLISH